MAPIRGFWSYNHDDDDAEDGRIRLLAHKVASEFELMTGDSIELFLDRDAIGWGQGWQSTVDESLSSVAFFVPVMTQRYFMSAECRRELQFFAQRATKLGFKGLVLPLLYVDVTSLHDGQSGTISSSSCGPFSGRTGAGCVSRTSRLRHTEEASIDS